jgi:dolichyl-phosphate-mannose-protein mannosyltransferase
MNFNFLKRIQYKEKYLILFVLFLAVITRLIFFGLPNEIVFDEVYFPKFASQYFEGEYYFDIHPPLAKLILAGSTKIFGYSPPSDFDFSKIGNQYPQTNYFKFLRFVIYFFGILLPLSIYFLTKQLFNNKWVAFFSGILAVFSNSLLVQSRFILTDIPLLVFGILGIAFFLKSEKKKYFSFEYFFWIILSSIFLSACFSVKWTGLVFVGIVGIFLIRNIFKRKFFERTFIPLTILSFVFLLFYSSVFFIHFQLLPKSGTGDKYMSSKFQSSLIGENYDKENASNIFEKIIELNAVMFSASYNLKENHPYGSKWYTWSILKRPIYYWYKQGENYSNRIYFQANPLIWWFSSLSMLYWFIWLLGEIKRKIFNKEKLNQYFFSIFILISGYLGNLLPYILINRVSFLYHYLPSLIFSIIGLSFLIYWYIKKYPQLIFLIFTIIFISFLFFSPLSYGLPLSNESYNMRIWFESWK